MPLSPGPVARELAICPIQGGLSLTLNVHRHQWSCFDVYRLGLGGRQNKEAPLLNNKSICTVW